jgi:putative transposase
MKKRIKQENTRTLAYEVRCYPSKEQVLILRKSFDACRVVWNWGLNEYTLNRIEYAKAQEEKAKLEKLKKEELNKTSDLIDTNNTQETPEKPEKKPNVFFTTSKKLTELLRKQAPVKPINNSVKKPKINSEDYDYSWLKPITRTVLTNTLMDLNKAYFDHYKNPRFGYPKPKKFKSVKSLTYQLDPRHISKTLSISNNNYKKTNNFGFVVLPSLGKLEFRLTQEMLGDIRTVNIREDGNNRWFISFTATNVPLPHVKPKTNNSIGLDLGVKDQVIDSFGKVYTLSLKQIKKKEEKLKYYQRVQARKDRYNKKKCKKLNINYNKSKRLIKTEAHISRLYSEIKNLKNDFLHKTTKQIVENNNIICLEDLNVKGLCRTLNRGFRKKVHLISLGQLKNQIIYKANWHSSTVVIIDRYFPSSKTCNICNKKNKGLTLEHRSWVCDGCHTLHDRDYNAAKNILKQGLCVLYDPTNSFNPEKIKVLHPVLRSSTGIGIASNSYADKSTPSEAEQTETVCFVDLDVTCSLHDTEKREKNHVNTLCLEHNGLT